MKFKVSQLEVEMADFKLDGDMVRDYSGSVYGRVDSNMTVWGSNSRAGYIDKDGSYMSEDGRYLGQVWGASNVGSTSSPYSGYSGSYSGSSSNAENILIGYLLGIALVVMFIAIIILATPILAPIFLSSAENAKKRRDKSEYDKWNGYAAIASIVAILVVLGIASSIGMSTYSTVNNSITPLFFRAAPYGISTQIILLISVAVAFVVFVLSFITGIAPTAVVYLLQKENHLNKMGKITTARNIRYTNWAIVIITFGTIIMTVGGLVLYFLFFIYKQ